MAIFHETAGSACLQLELGGALAASAEFGHYIAPGAGGHGRARADALLAITQVFSCRVAVYGYDATRHDKFLIITGARPVLDALDQLLPVIARRMEGAGRAAAGEYAKRVRAAMPQMPPSRRRGTLTVPYFRDYLRGFGSGAAVPSGPGRMPGGRPESKRNTRRSTTWCSPCSDVKPAMALGRRNASPGPSRERTVGEPAWRVAYAGRPRVPSGPQAGSA